MLIKIHEVETVSRILSEHCIFQRSSGSAGINFPITIASLEMTSIRGLVEKPDLAN